MVGPLGDLGGGAALGGTDGKVTLLAKAVAATLRLTKSAGVAPTGPYPGQLWYDSTDSSGMAVGNPDAGLYLPSGLYRTTITRASGGWSSSGVGALLSGRLQMQAIWLNAGELVSNIMFMSGSTAAGTPTNWWFTLYGTDGVTLLAQSADQTSTAWAASTEKILPMTTAYRVPASGYYYLGIMVKATTVPSLQGISTLVVITGLTPVVEGTSTTALSTTPPSTALAPTRTGNILYAGVS